MSTNWIYVINFCRTLYPTAADAEGTFTNIDHNLGHKTKLKFKRVVFTHGMFSDCNGIKLEISNRMITDY